MTIILETCVIWLLSRSDNDIRISSQMSSTGVRTSVWAASGMRHWRGMIKISDDTDYYYYYCLTQNIAR